VAPSHRAAAAGGRRPGGGGPAPPLGGAVKICDFGLAMSTDERPPRDALLLEKPDYYT